MGAEILSADSMQVYIGMDIGSAKPTPRDRLRVRHYGLDLADPRSFFSVADFCRCGWEVIRTCQTEGVPLVVCGGTGLYLKALFEGLSEAPPPDPAYRLGLEEVAEVDGAVAVHGLLETVDPESAAKIHPHDLKRTIRALEIHHSTGLTKSTFESTQEVPPWKDNVQWIGLRRPWEDLDCRINERVASMIESGLELEVRRLLRIGCGHRHTAMQGLGYKEMVEYLEGERSMDATRDLIAQRTRRFSRRQMTWFRPNRLIKWFDLYSTREANVVAAEIVPRLRALACQSVN